MLQVNQLADLSAFNQSTSTATFVSVYDKSAIFGPTFTGSPNTLNASNDTVVFITPVPISGFTQFKLYLINGADTTATITKMFLGQLSGLYSFASAPAQVKFAGADSFAFSAAAQTVVSDIVSYTPSGSGNLCIAASINTDNSQLRGRTSTANNSPAGWATYRKADVDDAATEAKTSYTVSGTTSTYLVYKVEGAP